MAQYREALPQLGDDVWLSDGGIETTLIFHEGLELPDFAAFHLLKTPAGEAALRAYFRTYADLARRHATGLVLESATWRANPDWAARLGYDRAALAEANRRAIGLLEALRADAASPATPVVISGCVGPRGDGYVPTNAMTAAAAADYHQAQVDTFAETAADLVTAITMNYADAAIGIARAAERAHLPVAISFTVETDGRLPTGQALGAAIAQVDDATGGYPAYYMLNCAHPTHFDHVLGANDAWVPRLRGLRANASRQSHAELNESTELDAGDPAELGRQYAALRARFPQLTVLGGCCGTDHRHLDAIASACVPRRS
jgi:homocysteine S-methyltransferase